MHQITNTYIILKLISILLNRMCLHYEVLVSASFILCCHNIIKQNQSKLMTGKFLFRCQIMIFILDNIVTFSCSTEFYKNILKSFVRCSKNLFIDTSIKERIPCQNTLIIILVSKINILCCYRTKLKIHQNF